MNTRPFYALLRSVIRVNDVGMKNYPAIPEATHADADALLKTWLGDDDGAVYTSMRTCGLRTRIFGYDEHLARLLVCEGTGGGAQAIRHIRSAVASVVQYHAEMSRGDASRGELRLMAAVRPATSGGPDAGGAELIVHACPLPSRPPGSSVDVLLVPSLSREQHGAVKSAAWIADRRAVDLRGCGCDEGLLLRADGDAVLEGMSSNVFVVYGGGGAGATPESVVLRTAPAEAHILPGTVRTMVLRAALEMGVAVEEVPPKVSEMGEWSALFITSTSRLVLPVAAVRGGIGEGESANRKIWTVEGDDVGHAAATEVVERIRKRVEEMVIENSSPVFGDKIPDL